MFFQAKFQSNFFRRYNEDTFIEKGIQYGDMFIRGTAREPPDFVVSEVMCKQIPILYCSTPFRLL